MVGKESRNGISRVLSAILQRGDAWARVGQERFQVGDLHQAGPSRAWTVDLTHELCDAS